VTNYEGNPASGVITITESNGDTHELDLSTLFAPGTKLCETVQDCVGPMVSATGLLGYNDASNRFDAGGALGQYPQSNGDGTVTWGAVTGAVGVSTAGVTGTGTPADPYRINGATANGTQWPDNCSQIPQIGPNGELRLPPEKGSAVAESNSPLVGVTDSDFAVGPGPLIGGYTYVGGTSQNIINNPYCGVMNNKLSSPGMEMSIVGTPVETGFVAAAPFYLIGGSWQIFGQGVDPYISFNAGQVLALDYSAGAPEWHRVLAGGASEVFGQRAAFYRSASIVGVGVQAEFVFGFQFDVSA
jgi:hypothetical protein